MELYEPLITGWRCDLCGEELGVIQAISIRNELNGNLEEHCVCSHCLQEIYYEANKILESDCFVSYAMGIAYMWLKEREASNKRRHCASRIGEWYDKKGKTEIKIVV